MHRSIELNWEGFLQGQGQSIRALLPFAPGNSNRQAKMSKLIHHGLVTNDIHYSRFGIGKYHNTF